MRKTKVFALAVLCCAPGMAQEARPPAGFTELLPAEERTPELVAEAQADRLKLAIAMAKMHQAQLLETDARLALSDARGELQMALAALLSVDQPRAKILQATQLVGQYAAEAGRLDKAYAELLERMREKYQAEGCVATQEIEWRCPAAGKPTQASGSDEVRTEEAEQ